TAVQQLEWLHSLPRPPPIATPAEPSSFDPTAPPLAPAHAHAPAPHLESSDAAADVHRAGALDRLGYSPPPRNVKTVFFIWILIFGLVGAQMSWLLRPFIGSGKEFALFRPRGGNFFEAVFNHLSKLMQ